MAFETIRMTLFTQIHGPPSQSNYKILKQEAATIASKVKAITYNWSRDTAAGDEYGLLAKILDLVKYDHQTAIPTYVQGPNQPATTRA
jgi:hypothetical protein